MSADSVPPQLLVAASNKAAGQSKVARVLLLCVRIQGHQVGAYLYFDKFTEASVYGTVTPMSLRIGTTE